MTSKDGCSHTVSPSRPVPLLDTIEIMPPYIVNASYSWMTVWSFAFHQDRMTRQVLKKRYTCQDEGKEGKEWRTHVLLHAMIRPCVLDRMNLCSYQSDWPSESLFAWCWQNLAKKLFTYPISFPSFSGHVTSPNTDITFSQCQIFKYISIVSFKFTVSLLWSHLSPSLARGTHPPTYKFGPYTHYYRSRTWLKTSRRCPGLHSWTIPHVT